MEPQHEGTRSDETAWKAQIMLVVLKGRIIWCALRLPELRFVPKPILTRKSRALSIRVRGCYFEAIFTTQSFAGNKLYAIFYALFFLCVLVMELY